MSFTINSRARNSYEGKNIDERSWVQKIAYRFFGDDAQVAEIDTELDEFRRSVSCCGAASENYHFERPPHAAFGAAIMPTADVCRSLRVAK